MRTTTRKEREREYLRIKCAWIPDTKMVMVAFLVGLVVASGWSCCVYHRRRELFHRSVNRARDYPSSRTEAQLRNVRMKTNFDLVKVSGSLNRDGGIFLEPCEDLHYKIRISRAMVRGGPKTRRPFCCAIFQPIVRDTAPPYR